MPTAAAGAVRPLAAIALASAGFDLLVFALLHAVQPGVDVLTEPTSGYVHGALGFLSPLAAGVVGLGGLCLATACWRVLSGSAARIGAGLLAVFGVAKLGQAFFPIDAAGEATSAGAAHNLLGNIAFFLLSGGGGPAHRGAGPRGRTPPTRLGGEHGELGVARPDRSGTGRGRAGLVRPGAAVLSGRCRRLDGAGLGLAAQAGPTARTRLTLRWSPVASEPPVGG